MKKTYQTVYKGGSAEIVEKKSRFIANAFPLTTEEEAQKILENLRKKYWDARHNCWAYVIDAEHPLARCSDDGEPAQTAGKPMLDVLVGRELYNVLVVVTRYFGGVLLGTGGLVRAYSKAAQEGLDQSIIVTKTLGVRISVGTDYSGIGKVQYLFGKRGLKALNTSYTDTVRMEVLVPEDDVERLKAEIREATAGKASMEELGKCWFAEVDGGVEILEE